MLMKNSNFVILLMIINWKLWLTFIRFFRFKVYVVRIEFWIRFFIFKFFFSVWSVKFYIWLIWKLFNNYLNIIVNVDDNVVIKIWKFNNINIEIKNNDWTINWFQKLTSYKTKHWEFFSNPFHLLANNLTNGISCIWFISKIAFVMNKTWSVKCFFLN